MAAYVSTPFTKDGQATIAYSWEDHMQLLWDGWVIGTPAQVVIDRSTKHATLTDLDAAIADAESTLQASIDDRLAALTTPAPSLTVLDNGDGTALLTTSASGALVDNNDGTATIAV